MSKRQVPRYRDLLKKGVPALLIPGIIWASLYGPRSWEKFKSYYASKQLFPTSGIVATVQDGDTLVLRSGHTVRLLGIDAPNRGQSGFDSARDYLRVRVENQPIWLEYDRYQDDKYGRLLAWVWTGCESNKPKFLPPDYMYVSKSESKDFVTKKPVGCQKGELLNRELVARQLADSVTYQGRGRLKYRLN